MPLFKIYYLALTFLSLILLPLQGQARPLVADISLREIAIDSSFKGTDLLFFGARIAAGDIVMVIRGPKRNFSVRKKERVGGIWVNTQHADFNDVYSFYALASNRPLAEIHNKRLLNDLHIGLDHLPLTMASDDLTAATTTPSSSPPVLKVDDEDDAVTDLDINAHEKTMIPNTHNRNNFANALFSHQQKSNLYLPEITDVAFIGDTLFRAVIHFPENIPSGTYLIETYIFSDGLLRGVQTTPLKVYHTGFEAFIYDLAHQWPFVYGILAITLALSIGWLGGIIFRKV